MNTQRGLLLIVLTGLLTLLLLLSVFFISMSRMERTRTGSGVGHVRAKLLARSGAEYAAARLLENPLPGSAGILPASSNSEDDWRYRDDPSVPLERSQNPSYASGEPYDDLFPDPPNGRYDDGQDSYTDLNRNGRRDAWTALLRGTYGFDSDRLSLRIADPTGRIAVNGNGSGPNGEPLTEDRNGNGLWDPGEPFTDRPTRFEGEGPVTWYSNHRKGKGEDPVVWGWVEPPNGTWDPGEPVEPGGDWNGNGRRDLIVYNSNDTVYRDESVFYDLARDSQWEQYKHDDTLGPRRFYNEPFVDSTKNGLYDPPEPYTDLNGNGVWDPPDGYEDRNGNGVWDGPQMGLMHLLGALGEVTGAGEELGKRVLEGSPYRTLGDVERTVGNETFGKIAPYISLEGRTDPHVIRPPVDHKQRNPAGQSFPFQAEVNKLWPLTQESRVPIPVNHALPPVLEAVFRPLEAAYLQRSCKAVSQGHISHPSIGEIGEARIRPAAAAALAQRIDDARNEGAVFSAWRQWEFWLDSLVSDAGFDLKSEEAALVNANVNPNSRLHKFNPDAVLDRSTAVNAGGPQIVSVNGIDKSDLTVYTTELSFDPSGLFEIASLGEVHGRAGSPLPLGEGPGVRASSRVHAVLSLWQEWRSTNQHDFAGGFIFPNSDPGLSPSYRNRSVQIYPEPETGDLGAAKWDGYLMLASNRSERLEGEESFAIPLDPGRVLSPGPQIDPDDPESLLVPDPAVDPTLLFYARFEEGLRGDFSRDGGNLDVFPETADWHPGWDNVPSGRPNENSVIDRGNPGSLFPDGIYSDWRNVPAYAFEGNFESEAGVVSFWLKYNGTENYIIHSACSFSFAPAFFDERSHRLAVVWRRAGGFGMILESRGDDQTESRPVLNPYRLPKGGWVHVGAAWDITRTLPKENSAFQLNWERYNLNRYAAFPNRETDAAFRFEADDGENRGRFRLGEINRPGDITQHRINNAACGTIDEFCIYGRQGEEGTDQHVQRAQQLWDRRVARGRYYNFGDAAFTSAPRRFPEGTRFLTMRWTSLIPDPEELQPAEGLTEMQNPMDRTASIFQGNYDELGQEGDVGRLRDEWRKGDHGWRVLVDFFDGRTWLLDLDGDGKLSTAEERIADVRGLTDEGGIPIGRNSAGEARGSAAEALYTLGLDSAPDGLIRWRVYIKEDADWLTQPLLESAVLDDVTITYVPEGGIRVIDYSEW